MLKLRNKNGLYIAIAITSAAIVFCLAANGIVLNKVDNSTLGRALAVFSIILFCVFSGEMILLKKYNRKHILSMARIITKTEKESLYNFPAPAIIIDDKNSIVWLNKAFKDKVYNENDPCGELLSSIIDIDMVKMFKPEGVLTCYNKKFYNIKAVHSKSPENFSTLYFDDVTDFVELDYESKQSHLSVIIILIDGYDDLMANIKESEKAHVAVEIEKLIEDFIESTTAVSKKVSSDKFYIFMEERHLVPIISEKFKILESARRIVVGERGNLTLSIGVGRDGKNLAENERLARQALELCLGRGGDQAAVKENQEIKFFGGIANSSDSSNRVKIRMFANALEELIKTHKKVLIMGHKYSDLDSVGSAVGLCCAVRQIIDDVYVVIDKENSMAKNLVEHIQKNDNMSDYFISPSKGLEWLDNNTLLIVVDTHNPDLVESHDILICSKHIVVIDHHRRMVNGISPTVIAYLDPGASSASELVTECIEYFTENIFINVSAAEALMSGIMLDTKSFVMKTGVNTFETAAFLKKHGADTVAVKKLFSNSIETYHHKSLLINSAKIYKKCAIAIEEECFDDIRIAASQAADELLGISEVDASFVIYESNDKVNISARSLGVFNVQIVMESLGGGGHLTMAAVQLKTTFEEAKTMLIKAIDDYIENKS